MDSIISYKELNFGCKYKNVDGTNDIIVKSPMDIVNEIVFTQLSNARNLIDLLEVVKVEYAFSNNVTLPNELRN
jgi:hypothetical protein